MATSLVTGANRGIGLELVSQQARRGDHVIACCRKPEEADELQALAANHASISVEALDVTDHGAIEQLAARHRDTPIDMLINNAGVIGPAPLADNLERQFFGSMDYDLWADVLAINTFGPVKVAEAFVEHVAASQQKKIITISSRVGSISEGTQPAMAYASSKAAVNKAMNMIANRLRDRSVIVAIVCPGHVQTRLAMGAGDVTVEESVSSMLKLFDEMTLDDSGAFKLYSGRSIGW